MKVDLLEKTHIVKKKEVNSVQVSTCHVTISSECKH